MERDASVVRDVADVPYWLVDNIQGVAARLTVFVDICWVVS